MDRIGKDPRNKSPLTEEVTIHSPSSIPELASRAGVPPDTLVATVAGYNDAVARGTLEGLNPARSTYRHKAFPILKPRDKETK